MNYKNIIKKQSFLIGISIFAMAVVLIGTSFAIVSQTKSSTNNQEVSIGTLSMSYQQGTTITGSMVPMTDEEGMEQSGYTFTITNTGTLPMIYDIIVGNKVDTTNNLDHQYIKYSIDGSEPTLLSSISEVESGTNERKIKEKETILESGLEGSSKSHTIKVWIDEDAPESIIGKTFALSAIVHGEVGEGNTRNLKVGDKVKLPLTGNEGTITSWVVIKEGVNPELVAETTSPNEFTAEGQNGYKKLIKLLNDEAASYKNDLVKTTRHIGYSNQTLECEDLCAQDNGHTTDKSLVEAAMGNMIAKTPSGEDTSYWLSKRSTYSTKYYSAFIHTDGTLNNNTLYDSSDNSEYLRRLRIRPIITLNSTVYLYETGNSSGYNNGKEYSLDQTASATGINTTSGKSLQEEIDQLSEILN